MANYLDNTGLAHVKEKIIDMDEVYVGTSEPTTGRYKIWIDTTEEADTYLQEGDNVSLLTNDAGYLTEHQSLADYRTSAAQDIIDSGKQDTISDLDTIRSGASAGATALQPSALDDYSTTTEMNTAISSYHDDAKQDKLSAYLKTATVNGNTLTITDKDDGTVIFTPEGKSYTAGTNVQISDTNVISATDTKYTAGTNITISDDYVISAAGGKVYSAGDNVQISATNVISATDTTYTAGTNITISDDNVISAASSSYSAGDNIQISGTNVISATDTTYSAGTNITISDDNVISATAAEPEDFIKSASVNDKTLTLTKKDGSTVTFTDTDTTYTAGTGVSISDDNVISASGKTYTAGTNVQISDTNVISATDTKYTAGTNVQISSSNVISATDTTYSAATTSSAGLMSASDKTKLNGIATGANNYTLPTATSSTLGGIKVGSNLSISSGVLNYTLPNSSSSVIGGITSRLDGTTLYLRNDG